MPLTLAGWLEFNRHRWGVRPETVQITAPGADLPAVSVVLYLDRCGRIRLPPDNPYAAVHFQPTPTQSRVRRGRQWLEVGAALAADMRRRGLAARLRLPPDLPDVRPWQWAGFRTGVRYTYWLDLPWDADAAGAAVRKSAARAGRLGYTCARTADMAAVVRCLAETEARRGFTHRLAPADLKLALSLLGEEHLRAYACVAPDGEPASARIVLYRPGARALDWVAGTAAAHLQSGATQLLIQHVLADLARTGAPAFDFAGANLPGVAAAKATWGAHLVPCYTLEPYGMLPLAAWIRGWWRFARPGKGG